MSYYFKKNYLLYITFFVLIFLTLASVICATVVYMDHLKQKSAEKFLTNPNLDLPPERDPKGSNNYHYSGNNLANLLDVLAPPETNYENFKTFGVVYGLSDIIAQLKEISHRFNMKNEKIYSRLNIKDYPLGVILYGPPGTGKTLLAQCFAKESEMNFFTIGPQHSLKEIEAVFKKARRQSPSIIFADEAEEIIKHRKSNNLEDGDTKKTDLLLAEIDGVKTDREKPVFFIAATNHLDKIDPAIRSRCKSIYVGYFSKAERLDYVKLMIRCKGYLLESGADRYLSILMDKFNRALDKPEEFAKALRKGYRIPTVGAKEVKGSVDENNSLGKLASLSDYEENDKLIKRYNEIYHNLARSGDYDIEDLEKIKVHFYDLLSGRKLEMFVNTAAYKAAKNGHNMILISDLEEAFKDFFGFSQEFAGVNNYRK
ncbi:MAG: AAA family ATPase [Vigna little leaf phytoplasma]|nr:AAA family ATPase [Vigna little leaf phytoplasma]